MKRDTQINKKTTSRTTPKVVGGVPAGFISLDNHVEDVKRYIGAVSEDFKHQVSAIAEQFLGLNEKLDRHTEILDTHTEMLGRHSAILGSHTQQFLGLDDRLGVIDEKLDSHTEILGRLMTDVEEIKVSMDEKVDRKEFSKLETRLVALESFVFTKHGKAAKK